MPNTIRFPQPAAATVQPAFAHPGGKRRLLKHILPHLPKHRVYCEPFAGAAALLLAKPRAPLEIINDIDASMITFYNYSVHHRDVLLAELLKHAPQSRLNFDALLHNPGITDLQRAARWFILRVCSFGAKSETWGRGRRNFHGYDPTRHNILIDRLGARLQRVIVENRDWLDIVNFYDNPDAFFFFDPPYVNCGDTAYAAFTIEQMTELRERLNTMSGTWLLTCDDSAACRKIFTGLPVLRMSIKYSLGNKSVAGTSAKTISGKEPPPSTLSLKGNKAVKESGELLIFHPSLAPIGAEILSSGTVNFKLPSKRTKRKVC